MCTSWNGLGDPPGKDKVVTPWDNFMTRAELIAYYGELTGRDMASMPWFAVLACYKLACILEGSYARACAGKAPKEIGEKLHLYAIWLMARAQQIIGKGAV
jgi:aminoglycoside phosphotransferase (APT) family kinase protein